MIPIYLDPAAIRVAVIGRGALALGRIAWLRAAGATPDVWSDAPSAELAKDTPELVRRAPSPEELARYGAVWIADLAPAEAGRLTAAARDLGVLVNVEDIAELCDFHTPAVVRRGRLTLAAGTGGASPAVARAARERLEAAFPAAWEAALEEIAQSRQALRHRRASLETMIVDARQRLAQRGLI
jgi:precorrin-2 dehydrogenase/sirohydrochlorin ferrochelatase